MRRVFHGLGAACGLIAVAVGVPLLLTRLAGWPLPTAVPNWSNVYWAVRQQNVPAEFVVKAIAVVAWIAWAQLMWAIVWELAVNVPRQLRGQRARTAPVAWAPMASARMALVLGRKGMPFRALERRQVAALARIVDTRFRELSTARARAEHPSSSSRPVS